MEQDDSGEKRWRSLRLRSWDYRNAGAYFLTFVTHNREPFFGKIVNGNVLLSSYGEIAQEEWFTSADIRQEIRLDVFVVMPNHVHGIVWLENPKESLPLTQPAIRSRGPATRSIGAFVAGFKATVTRRINGARGTPGAGGWQRNYYERVIRNERELDAIRLYIEANPGQWARDPENPGGRVSTI